MLKLLVGFKPNHAAVPAAFRRLCVETVPYCCYLFRVIPAAFRRLCVETENKDLKTANFMGQPPSGGCVLKLCSKLR